MGFMGVEALWGDVWACVGLVLVNGGVLNRSIEHKVVGRDSAAVGIISLANVVVVGLGRVGSNLGMTRALSSGWEFMVRGGECRDASSHPCMVRSRGVVVAVLAARGSFSGISSRILGDAPSHLMRKCLWSVGHDVRTSGAKFSNFSYHSSACEYVGR